MSVESNVSGHWTDEQLIAHLYGIGPEDRHLARRQLRDKVAGEVYDERSLSRAQRPDAVSGRPSLQLLSGHVLSPTQRVTAATRL